MPTDDDATYDTPPDDAAIWRYLTFSKFALFLRTGLWVPTVRLLRTIDPFESSYTYGELAYLEQLTRSARFVQHLPTLSEHLAKDKTFISCWFEGESENVGMWALYVGSATDAGVAIRTTVGKLKAVLAPLEQPFNIARATYDFDPDATGHVAGHRLYFRKRPELRHENEVRAVIVDLRPGHQEGFTVPVAHGDFIDEVRLCPRSPRWFRELVQDETRRAGVPAGRVLRSQIDRHPPPSLAD